MESADPEAARRNGRSVRYTDSGDFVLVVRIIREAARMEQNQMAGSEETRLITQFSRILQSRLVDQLR
jgi:hypothetical protein